MAKLREALEEAGFGDVLTHLQSGNVVLSSNTKPEQTARKCERLIKAEFGLEIDVVVRTSADLARVVKRDPLGKVATDPKCYQVSFLAGELPAGTIRDIDPDTETIFVDLTKDAIKNAPEFDEKTYRDQSYRNELGSYYSGRSGTT